MVQITDKNLIPFWSILSGRVTKVPPPSPPLRDIGHSIRIGNLILSVSSVTVSYLIHYDSLLQNATDIITKCDRYYYKMRQLFYYKMRQKLITKCVRCFITKCNSFITKCDSYYKFRQLYYKMRRLLQIATVHLSVIIDITLQSLFWEELKDLFKIACFFREILRSC